MIGQPRGQPCRPGIELGVSQSTTVGDGGRRVRSLTHVRAEHVDDRPRHRRALGVVPLHQDLVGPGLVHHLDQARRDVRVVDHRTHQGEQLLQEQAEVGLAVPGGVAV